MKEFRRTVQRTSLWAWRSVLFACGAASACTDTNLPPEPPSFERPNRVALVCVDYGQDLSDPSALVSMDRCTTKSPVDAGLIDTPETNYRLQALVTQSSRGEVAAVDVIDRHVIDSRSDIPGPTFVPVGELPVAVAVSPRFPRRTYVANAGSHDISVMRTNAFLKGALGERTTLTHVLLQTQPGMPAATPYDMVIAPNQDALFVSSVDTGELLRFPIKRCADGTGNCAEDGELDVANIQVISLSESWSKVPASAFENNGGGVAEPEPYRFACAEVTKYLLPTPSTAVELPDPGANVGAPQPAGMALDAFCDKQTDPDGCTRKLLIADKRQPIIHVVDVDSLAVLPPILSGAPTERVVVSPPVPVDVSEAPSNTQYVYAIDARDGSVLVAQDGRVRNVNVNSSQRADRLDLGIALASGPGVALSLSVITPDFDTRNPGPQWLTLSEDPLTVNDPLSCLDPSHTIRTANRLRGVFLTVGMTDGTIRIVNVHDMELRSCRSCTVGELAAYNAGTTGYDPYPVVRHRARIGVATSFTTTRDPPTITPAVTPAFFVQGATIGVRVDGVTGDTRANGLDCVTCSSDKIASFPAPGNLLGSALDGGTQTATALDDGCGQDQARVCSASDPFVDPFVWVGAYEGAIPGTRGGNGHFVPPGDADNRSGSLEFVGGPNYCNAGVLGDDALPAGDQLEILSALPNDKLRESTSSALDETTRKLCDQLISLRDAGEDAIAFRITAAFTDRLVLEPNIHHGQGSAQPDATWEQVSACFADMLLAFQVHASESFVFQSSVEVAFQHNVQASDDGRCFDTRADRRKNSRVRSGELFDNGLLAFQLTAGDYLPGTTFRLTSISGSPKLFMDGSNMGAGGIVRGVMPVDMQYSSTNETLYAVDITARGLIPLTFDPMPYRMDYGTTVQ